jgi:MscS family membrane protein
MDALAQTTQNANEIVDEQMNAFTTYLGETLHIEPSWLWITQIFVIVLFTLSASYLANRTLKRLRKRLERTQTTWDDTIVEAARKPVRTAIWIVGLCYAMDIIYKETGAEIFAGVDALRDVGIIAMLAWWLLRFIRTFEENIILIREARGEPLDRTTVAAIAKLLKASVIITSGLVMLQTLGFSISGVLAFGGVGGIAVGFAAKDLLANFFGAMTVYFDRPFCVGDWIRSPDKHIEGTVEHIGWRQTRILTFEKRPLYVPNSLFTTIVVENPSRMSHRRINETIGIRYDDIHAMHAITQDVRAMLHKHPEIDDSQTLMVNFNAFNASSVDFFIYCFTHTTVWTKYHEIKHEILLNISDIIAGHGAEIAFPTQTLHVPDALHVAMPAHQDKQQKKKTA